MARTFALVDPCDGFSMRTLYGSGGGPHDRLNRFRLWMLHLRTSMWNI